MSPARARLLGRLTVVGVSFYVGAWLVAGWWTPGYDPVTQAISELFALGAPAGPRWLVTIALVVTGLLLVAFGGALEVLLPGTGRAAPIACAVSGVATLLIPLAPCSPGCPGFGTTPTDSAHLLFAATGYVALIATPLLAAWRVRDDDRRLAVVSVAFGLVATIGFVIGASAQFQEVGGLVQRVYNTTADAWLVVAGLWLTRGPGTRPGRP
ncbi:DUF998 domain-containing protein [Salsipaludibacter albus]|uniref:DUF998 domain-containing protein n=1 Tax=Salsipaludibacter albus TaxID=2849650 RepID=UPI001EE4CCF7|nr:DUF998 domain-containing protein [Salsipaludibacter albus]